MPAKTQKIWGDLISLPSGEQYTCYPAISWMSSLVCVHPKPFSPHSSSHTQRGSTLRQAAYSSVQFSVSTFKRKCNLRCLEQISLQSFPEQAAKGDQMDCAPLPFELREKHQNKQPEGSLSTVVFVPNRIDAARSV